MGENQQRRLSVRSVVCFVWRRSFLLLEPSSPLALVLADLHQGILAHIDEVFIARLPQHTREQRRLPILVSYRLFLTLLPLALEGDEEHQQAIVREMKTVLYRYWEPIMED